MEATKSIIGYRFNPTDEELVNYYLKNKIVGNDFMVSNISHIHLLNYAPQELPAKLKMKSDEKEGFFFTCLDLMKNNKIKRFNRKAKGGYWKISGKGCIIKKKGTNNVIGIKKTVLFFTSDHKKTNWVNHEYHANEAICPHNKTNLVLCRLMNKGEQVTHSSSHVSAADFDKQPMMDLAQDNKTLHIPGTMQIGYRFQPTEEELVGHYLEHKLFGNDDSIVSNIAEVNLNSIEPWELPALLKTTLDDSEWYFFTTDDLKYKTSTRCIRTTNAGYWKKTGITREIKIKGTNDVIGTKKIFVFYKRCGPHDEKTNWVMHQYHTINVPNYNKRNFVLCRLMHKTKVVRDELMYDEGVSNHVAGGAELESIAPTDLTPNVSGSSEVNMDYNLLASPYEDEYSLPDYSFQATTAHETPYFKGLTSSNAHFKTDEEDN